MPSVARIVGITIASMIPVALSMMSRSAAAIGPCGSNTPPEQPPSVAAPARTTARITYRISDLVRAEIGGDARGARRSRHGWRLHRSDRSSARGGEHGKPAIGAVVGQQCCEQHEQVGNGKPEQTVSSSPIDLASPSQLPRE